MTAPVTLLWIRRDLRLADNPALRAALDAGGTVIPVYIHAPDQDGNWAMGSASRWWLHHSLAALAQALAEKGSQLLIRTGEVLPTLTALVAETGATAVVWNRVYEPAEIGRDTRIKQSLSEAGLRVDTFNSQLLFEPWEIRRDGGQPYRVFTPFWKALQAQGIYRRPEPAPEHLPAVPAGLASVPLEALKLLPTIPWDSGFYRCWTVGEGAALQRLDAFIDEAVVDYKTRRDIPGQAGTSRLSPHLHFGEISPRQVVSALQDRLGFALGTGGECFIREVAWREFAYHLLFHFPQTPEQPLDTRFAQLPWRPAAGEDWLDWRRGQTGYPIIDAGLRELWQTGWMHNRVRMIAASFLTKNLLMHWLDGARWFWDTLVDADLACNTLGWQWTAGCGADAAPYFRIFNPVLQGERFDPEGDYVRRWVPELARVPTRLIHRPWEAGEADLAAAGVRLGRDYPRPRVDLKRSRERALAAFAGLKTPGLDG